MGRGFFVKTELLVIWYDLPATSRLKSRSQALTICIPCKQRKQLLLKKLWSKSSWRCTCVWRCQFLRLHTWVWGPPRQLFISDVFGCVRTPHLPCCLVVANGPENHRTYFVDHTFFMIHKTCSLVNRTRVTVHRTSAKVYRQSSIEHKTYPLDHRTLPTVHRTCSMSHKTCSMDHRTYSRDQKLGTCLRTIERVV